ncbi:hypothetical protein V1514DRAFT_212778 [Lipomyces japonicus]|uniref:uncharacterized protein n=1 Tax=Lipomyces japonicus TaxID=56871 RepID=UPI0034CE71F4
MSSQNNYISGQELGVHSGSNSVAQTQQRPPSDYSHGLSEYQINQQEQQQQNYGVNSHVKAQSHYVPTLNPHSNSSAPAPVSAASWSAAGGNSLTEDYSQPGTRGVVDVEQVYHAVPFNGVYFGPYLRYANVDLKTGTWHGSVLIVTSLSVAPYFQVHPTNEISAIQSIQAQQIYQFDDYKFFRYDMFLPQLPGQQGQFWTYAITATQGQTLTYQFLVAGKDEKEWRFMAFSCADFSLSVKQEEREELGGVGYLWEDVIDRHHKLGGLHAMLGGGDQIYADRMWKEIPSLQTWQQTKGKQNRKDYEWSDRLERELTLAYFFYYANHFDRIGIRDCLAQIPNVFQIDDHDIFDGYGSYPEYMQESNVFINIGRIAFQFYLLFQHQTTEQILQTNPDPTDLFTVTGRGWHFIKYLGPSAAVLGPDTRAERQQKSIIGEQTHQELFRRLQQLPPEIRQVVIMLAVPIVYPRLTAVEHILTGVKHTKRAINGAWNVLGKATSKVASVVGGKKSTQSGFESVKKAFGKSGVMSSLISGFGEIDLLDDLADHWTHENHAAERIYFVRNLQRVAQIKSVRITFVSGDVHCCGIGRFVNDDRPNNNQLMYQIITSAISNVPPPGPVIRLLHNRDKIYLPEIGAKVEDDENKTDTREEMLEFFDRDVDGKELGRKKLLGRRNYAIAVIDNDGTMAWDLYVQKGGGKYGPSQRTAKYGPLIVPLLTSVVTGQQQQQAYGNLTVVPDGPGYDEEVRRQQIITAPVGVYGPGGIAEDLRNVHLQPQQPSY